MRPFSYPSTLILLAKISYPATLKRFEKTDDISRRKLNRKNSLDRKIGLGKNDKIILRFQEKTINEFILPLEVGI